MGELEVNFEFKSAGPGVSLHSPDARSPRGAQVRKFVDEEITDNCFEWDEAKQVPDEVVQKSACLDGCQEC